MSWAFFVLEVDCFELRAASDEFRARARATARATATAQDRLGERHVT